MEGLISLGLWIIFTMLVIIIALLFIPFFFTIDSEEKVFQIRWHLFEVGISLSNQTILFGIAGMRYHKRRKSTPPMPGRHSDPKETQKSKRASIPAILFSQRSLVKDLVPKVVRYLIHLFRRAAICEIRWNVSSSNLIINGICYGLFQAVRMTNVHLSINFFEENRFIGRFSLQLFRIIVPTIRLLIHLPYARLFGVYSELRGNAAQPAGS
jgi:hypothetical protein